MAPLSLLLSGHRWAVLWPPSVTPFCERRAVLRIGAPTVLCLCRPLEGAVPCSQGNTSLLGTCTTATALEPTGCCSDTTRLLEASRAYLAQRPLGTMSTISSETLASLIGTQLFNASAEQRADRRSIESLKMGGSLQHLPHVSPVLP